jgi:hypothetical protein
MTIGSDPEILLCDANGFQSAIDKLPGTKEEPQVITNGIVHIDNVAGEFGTTPVTSVQAFDDVVSEVYAQVNDIVRSVKLQISPHSVGDYNPADLQHPLAREAGCMPDWNVYTGELNDPPDFEATTLRCAGGHVHIGTDIPTSDHKKLIGALDALIAIPMLEHDHPLRRTMYGKAGCYRLKDYGIEYRTPSNFWIFNSVRRRWIAEQVERALTSYAKLPMPKDIQSIINNHDTDRAAEYMHAAGLEACPV